MTKRLEEVYGFDSEDKTEQRDLTMADVANIAEQINEAPQDSEETMTSAYKTLSKIENALPQVKGLEASDLELDELAKLATDSFTQLNDLGYQVDSRSMGEIFNVASSMLGHAITAKTAKLNKKIKMIELSLKQAALQEKLQNKQTQDNSEHPSRADGPSLSFDRTELLKNILAKK
jgi:hypothetical protein